MGEGLQKNPEYVRLSELKDKKLLCLNEVDNDWSLTSLSLHQLDTDFLEYNKTDVGGREVK